MNTIQYFDVIVYISILFRNKTASIALMGAMFGAILSNKYGTPLHHIVAMLIAFGVLVQSGIKVNKLIASLVIYRIVFMQIFIDSVLYNIVDGLILLTQMILGFIGNNNDTGHKRWSVSRHNNITWSVLLGFKANPNITLHKKSNEKDM